MEPSAFQDASSQSDSQAAFSRYHGFDFAQRGLHYRGSRKSAAAQSTGYPLGSDSDTMAENLSDMRDALRSHEGRFGSIEKSLESISAVIQRVEGGLSLSNERLKDLSEKTSEVSRTVEKASESISKLNTDTLALGIKLDGLHDQVSKLPDKDWVHGRGWILLGATSAVLAAFKYILP